MPPPAWNAVECRDLEVSSALAFGMSHRRRLGLPILECGLAVRAGALPLLDARAPNQLGVADGAVAAQMTGYGEIVDGANRDRVLRHLP